MSKKSEAIELLLRFRDDMKDMKVEDANKRIDGIIVKIIEIDDTQHAPTYVPYYIPQQPCPPPAPQPYNPWWEPPYKYWCGTSTGETITWVNAPKNPDGPTYIYHT